LALVFSLTLEDNKLFKGWDILGHVNPFNFPLLLC